MKLIELNIDKINALWKNIGSEIVGVRLDPHASLQRRERRWLLSHFPLWSDSRPVCDFFDFIDELQHLLGRKVDLVDETAVRNSYFRRELDKTKRLIYGWLYWKSLSDILSSIENIELFCSSRPKEFKTFCPLTLQHLRAETSGTLIVILM